LLRLEYRSSSLQTPGPAAPNTSCVAFTILYTVYNTLQVVIRMRQIQVSGPLPVGAPHAIPMQTGHYRLADGSLLRVDVVKTQIHGNAAKVHAWVDEIAARYCVAAGFPVAAPRG
jgi:hypothetical protein